MARPSKISDIYYLQSLRVVYFIASTLPVIVVALGFLAKFNWLDGRFYANDFVYATIAVGFTVATAINYYYAFVRKHMTPPLYLGLAIAFHILAVGFLLFVGGVFSPFLLGWIVLVIAIDIYFGTTATLLSLLTLCLTGLASILLYPFLNTQEQLSTFVAIGFVCVVSLLLARLRNVSDQERMALAKTRDQSNFQRERLLALVNSMGDAVITTDELGEIKVYNAATLSLLDTNANLLGKNIDTLLKMRDNSGQKISLIELASKQRKVFSRTDLVHPYEDNEEINLYVNVAPVQPGYRARGERGYIFILRDITKEKTLEEERDEFVSVVSHELRTPLAIAEGNLSNISLLQKRGATGDVIDKAVASSHEQIMYLSKLVNDLSTLSRAERGIGNEAEAIDLGALIHDLYRTYQPQAEAKSLQFNLDAEQQLPKLFSSRLYLEEILQNFITNAIKYTKQGSVTLSAKRAREGTVISVTDTGIGMSKSDQKHIFEKFYRSEDYRTRESSGTGLGLYVCKKLAEKLGMDITFESRLNHGSTFTFVIPTSQYATGAQAVAPQTGDAQ